MVVVHNPKVCLAGRNTLLAGLSRRQRRPARGVYYLYVAILIKVHLIAEQRLARRAGVGLQCIFNHQHTVGRRAEGLEVHIRAVGDVARAAKEDYLGQVLVQVAGMERRALIAAGGEGACAAQSQHTCQSDRELRIACVGKRKVKTNVLDIRAAVIDASVYK